LAGGIAALATPLHQPTTGWISGPAADFTVCRCDIACRRISHLATYLVVALRGRFQACRSSGLGLNDALRGRWFSGNFWFCVQKIDK